MSAPRTGDGARPPRETAGDASEPDTDDAAVAAVVAAVADPARRADLAALVALFTEVTGVPPRAWPGGLIGFGTMRYRYASGHAGTWFRVGVAARKTDLSLHLALNLRDDPELRARLGRHRTGAGCLYLRRLADADPEVLRALVADGFAGTLAAFPDPG